MKRQVVGMEVYRFRRLSANTDIAKILGIGGIESCNTICDHRPSQQTVSVRILIVYKCCCVEIVETFFPILLGIEKKIASREQHVLSKKL